MRFEEYYLIENIFGDFINLIKKTKDRIIKSLKSLFETLNFGDSIKINFNISKNVKEQDEVVNVEEGKDLKSRIGYHIERFCAVSLCKKLEENNFKLASADLYSKLQNEMENKKSEIIKLFQKDELEKAFKIADEQGEALASSMFENIQKSTESGICTYNIEVTGKKEKFKSKADLIVTKIDGNNLTKQILISIKAYKKWDINFLNSTFISFIKKLMFPNIDGKGMDFVGNLLVSLDNGNLSPNTTKILRRTKEVADFANDFVKKYKVEKGKGNPKYRKSATDLMNKTMEGGKSRYQIIGDFVIELFNLLYNEKPKDMNENFIKMIGLNSEEIYIAVTQKNKTVVLNTSVSKKFQKLVENLKKEFTMKATRVEGSSGNSFKILVIGKDGTTILSFKVPLKEEGKLNLWLKMKEFKDD